MVNPSSLTTPRTRSGEVSRSTSIATLLPMPISTTPAAMPPTTITRMYSITSRAIEGPTGWSGIVSVFMWRIDRPRGRDRPAPEP